MKTLNNEIKIRVELVEFLEKTGMTQAKLADLSGVNAVFISRLISGKQKDIASAKADALRDAMQRLSGS